MIRTTCRCRSASTANKVSSVQREFKEIKKKNHSNNKLAVKPGVAVEALLQRTRLVLCSGNSTTTDKNVNKCLY